MNGITMIASTKLARQDADAERRPLEQLADARQRPELVDQPGLHVRCRIGASTNRPQMPKMMLGTAASSSIAMPTGRFSHAGAQLGEEDRDAEAHRESPAAARGSEVTSVP